MSEIKKGVELARGKTKVIYEAVGRPGKGIISSMDDITKNDNKKETRQMDGKGAYSNITTCAIFRLLKQAGLPVAFDEQLSVTDFLAPLCKMIPLEVIIRRYIVPASSYLKRCPHLSKQVKQAPLRFHRLKFEMFVKTTGGRILSFDGKSLGETPIFQSGVDPLVDFFLGEQEAKHVDDPYIGDSYADVWELFHPKLPDWLPAADLKLNVNPSLILAPGVTVKDIEELVRKAFLVIEGAWAQLGCREVDIKVELGIDSEGKLLIADVIDNDSWRVRDHNWEELSKQLFRDNVDMAQIADKYALVANLVQRFFIPKQALVFWCGSEKDEPELPKELPVVAGVDVVKIFISGHKEPELMIDKVEELLAAYPQGGVIVVPVGMSDGLAPTVAARMSWPIIAVPLTVEAKPHDVWSSLEMPSQVPPTTALNIKNAILHALNILGQKNPAAYMVRQYALEKLDKK